MSVEQERYERGERARTILSDPLVRELLLDIEREIVTQWIAAAAPDKRERAHAQINAVRWLRERLELTVQQGEHSALLLQNEDEQES